MKKVRIYELAKELNTTSKRLMEKLAEININVKNHMSLLEDNELELLYNHIGIIRHDEAKKPEVGDNRPMTPAASDSEKRTSMVAARNQGPRIIRKTEIIINTQNDGRENETAKNGSKSGRKNSFVRVADNNSGLRAGFVRDTGVYPKPADKVNKGGSAAKNEKPEAKSNAMPQSQQKAPDEMQVRTGGMAQPAAEETKKQEKAVVDLAKNQTPVNEAPKQEAALSKEGIEKPKPEAAAKEAEKKEIVKPEAEKKETEKPDAEKKETGKKEAKKKESEKPQAIKDNVDQQHKVNNSEVDVKNDTKNDTPNNIATAGPAEGEKITTMPENKSDTRLNEQSTTNLNRDTARQHGNRVQRQERQDRQQGDRQQGGRTGSEKQHGDKAHGDRQQNTKPYGGRSQDNKPQGDRPQGDKPYGDRQQGDKSQGGKPFGDRPQGGKPYGDRPQGGKPFGDKPQGGKPQGGKPYGDKPQGDRPQGGRPFGGKPQSDKPQGGFRQNRPLDIPKTEMTDAQKEELYSQRNEARREYQAKDIDKDIKREQRRDVPKVQPVEKKNRFKPQKLLIEKKGISEVLSEDFIFEEFYDTDGIKRRRKAPKPKKENENKHIPHKAVLTNIKIPETITVKDLAEALKKTATEVIKKLMSLGMMVTVNNELDFDTAALVADEFGVKAEKNIEITDEDILFDDDVPDDEANLKPRPPVVVVMGHVDHGKTSLLDAIRSAHVIDSEAGGITQHIGAYTVSIKDRNITFLDTPGHEAFTAMRARGAQVTDIAILVVAADDGVMPQTIEAINHAKAANVSIIVAINKIDKPGANPDKVKQELTEYGLVAEEWGGDVIFVPVSALKKTNIDLLLEMVLLTADMLELKANPDRQAKGTIIEAKLDKNRGPVATALVQRGTLNVGDSLITGVTVGRVRVMTDDKGNRIEKAGPSTPVEIVGLSEVPEAGETFYAITDERTAKHLVEKRKRQLREQKLKTTSIVTLDDLFNQIKQGEVKELNLIIKADVQGSVEAVKQSLEKLSNEEVRVKTIHGAVGAITESDVTLAQVSNAIIIGFNVRPNANASELAERIGVDMRLYRVIYKAIEDIEAAMKGMLEPTFKEEVQGHAEIRQIFKASDIGTIGGCYVTDGKITRNSDVRVVRDGIVIHEGKLASLKRFKDDVREVVQGYECGLSIEKFNDIKEGDVIEAYAMVKVER